jgi:hypothetical protein
MSYIVPPESNTSDKKHGPQQLDELAALAWWIINDFFNSIGQTRSGPLRPFS